MTKKQKIILAIVGAALLGGIGFFIYTKKITGLTSVAGTKDSKLIVAASIFPIGNIAEQVGGDKVQVVIILPPGVSEHTYEPTPEAVKSATGAKLFLKAGFGLDDWTDQIARSINEALPIKDVSAGITLRTSTENHGLGDEEKGVGFPEPSIDPHYFLTLANGAQVAINIANYLGEVDPQNRSVYQKNAAAYAQLLRDEDARIKDKLATLPVKKIATFHEAWGYFAEHYGLEVVATFEPFPGKEPGPQYLADFIKSLKEDNIKVLFTEPQFSSDAIRQVATDLNIMLAPLDPIGGTSPQTQSYLDLIRYNADTVFTLLVQ